MACTSDSYVTGNLTFPASAKDSNPSFNLKSSLSHQIDLHHDLDFRCGRGQTQVRSSVLVLASICPWLRPALQAAWEQSFEDPVVVILPEVDGDDLQFFVGGLLQSPDLHINPNTARSNTRSPILYRS